ncbi:MAG TPA: TetR/AcrR family transcriptional regulator [Ktedonobacteraceae bacterium]|nr:TetR/AcrR family transcriptional regulator [Ktedonobacteraceae bacterium]
MATTRQHARRTRTHNAPPEQPSERQPASDERKLREERLLDAATTLLVRWGYRKTTIDDVAREAGVGKGTIYLHWKDKNELFQAAIVREQHRYSKDLQRRIAADPQGGLLHRVVTHGMLATFSNPLVAAVIRGNSDIFNGLIGTYEPAFFNQLLGDSDTYFAQLQEAGLIRKDIPPSTITYLLTALKVGIIHSPDIFSPEHQPSMEQLTEGVSDMIHGWLEPAKLPEQTDTGKQMFTELLDKVKDLNNGLNEEENAHHDSNHRS